MTVEPTTADDPVIAALLHALAAGTGASSATLHGVGDDGAGILARWGSSEGAHATTGIAGQVADSGQPLALVVDGRPLLAAACWSADELVAVLGLAGEPGGAAFGIDDLEVAELLAEVAAAAVVAAARR